MRIAKTVLSEQIKKQLIDNILSKKYLPGDRLVENTLASEFGVSQAPVREALKSLEEMGLVTQEPYKGTTVRAITNEDIYEAFTVRAALESIAAGLAARYSTAEDVRKLEAILDKMIETAQDGDKQNRMRLNNDFHDEVMRISGHKLIIKLSQYLRFTSWSYLKGSRADDDPVRMTRRHRKLVDAIASHDEDAAAAAMQKHITDYMPEIGEREAQQVEAPENESVSLKAQALNLT